MNKIALITDLHFGARSANTVLLAHQERFYSTVFFPYLKANGIDTVVCLGDTFDNRKATNNYIIEQSKKIFFDELHKNNITSYFIVGNHDAAFKNSLEVNTIDLLTREYDNVISIDKPSTVSVKGVNICMIPWICADNYDDSMAMINTSPSDICFGHYEIEGFQMHRGVESHGGLSQSMFDRYDKVFSGHYHHRSTKKNITYLGTPYEMTWADYDDPKGFHIFDLETRELTFIENPNQLFLRLEYTDQPVSTINPDDIKDKYIKLIVVSKNDFYNFDNFVNALQDYGAIDVKIIEDSIDYTSDFIDNDVKLEDTQSIIDICIDAIETSIDKSKVKNLIQSLYLESLNSEIL